MRNLKITVNGVAYDVQVEDVAGGAVSAPAAAPAPKAAAPAPKAAAPAAKAAGSVEITIPMPGTIISVNATVGKKVSKGETLVVFEAMKMENEIVCPQDGVVAAVLCSKGENKESGAVLITLE